MNIFNDSTQKIESFYEDHQYQLGWRFLNCSKEVLVSDPKVAFITLNPGGREIPEDQPWASCEGGSSYLNEIWGTSSRGQNKLQIQIQKMFAKLVEHSGYSGTTEELIEETLSGYFVPFRSGRLAELPEKKEAFAFGAQLWSEILKTIRPSLFICIDRDTFKRIKPIISNCYGLAETHSEPVRTGWGDYTGDIVEFGSGSENIKLLRLPHLSTFKLFSSEKCTVDIDNIFSRFCSRG